MRKVHIKMNSKNQILDRATQQLMGSLLRMVSFPKDLPKSLICFKCVLIISKPYQLSCGHRVCQSCIDPFLNSIAKAADGKQYCPDDGDEIDSYFEDKSALIEILNLKCYCVHKQAGCQWENLFMDLEIHLKTCEFNKKRDCPFHKIGCGFKGYIKEVEDHLEKEFTLHNNFFIAAIHTVENDVKINEEMFKLLSKHVHQLENREIPSVRNNLDELEKYLRNIKKFPKDMIDKHLLHKMETIEQTDIKAKQKMLEDKISQTEQYLIIAKDIQESSSSGSMLQEIDSVTEKSRRLIEEHKINSSLIEKLHLQTKLFQATSFDGTYTWKIDSLRNRFTEAVSGKVTELFTPPLYTSHFGYKYCAKILLNGDKKRFSEGFRTPHVAFYIILRQGEYDETLKFPFPYSITITMLNMNKKDNISYVLVPDEDKKAFQKPIRDYNQPIGFHKFCSHDSLYSDGFVKEDAIYIKIEVEKKKADDP